MPRVYKPGNRVSGYVIEREINRGLTAFSYEARDRKGRSVFLKQYRSPTVQVPWYAAYREYQARLRERIERGACQNFCYRFLQSFEFHRCFFQSFEYLNRSDSLEELLARLERGMTQVTASQRLIMAKVFVGGVHALHQAGLVHSDLKPANVMLIRDRSVMAGYRVKIIDMDFSLMTDRLAPWHGERGYFGTPGYLSPEHLRGEVPSAASDIFTLGLMLHELIGDGHPYRFDSDDEYREAVLAHRASRPKILAGLDREINTERVAALIHDCLAPDPGQRPDAWSVSLALNNHDGTAESLPFGMLDDSHEPLPMVEFDEPTDPGVEPFFDTGSRTEALVIPRSVRFSRLRKTITGRLLLHADGKERAFNVTTWLGRHLLRAFGPESRFADEKQFRLVRTEEGWMLQPNPEAANDTLLNGRRVTVEVPLSEGDVIAVGRESKGIVKLPMTVKPG